MTKGWHTKKLGDLLEVQNGYAFSSKDYSASGHFVIRIGNVQNGYISLTDPKYIDLPADGALQRFVLSEGDVLVSLTGNVGRVGVIQKEHLPAALNQRVARLTIREGSPASIEFLLFFLYSDWFREELIGAGHGAAQQNVSTKDLVEIELPVPPLSEQRRIVGILDEAFEGLATAKANAEQNLQNARALFESHLQAVFTQRGAGWVESALGDVCEFENGDRGKNYPNRNEYVESGIPWINTGHIQRDGTLSHSDMNFITQEKYESLRSGKIQPGDLVYCLRGATLGKTALVEPYTAGAVASSLVILRPRRSLDSRFLYSFLTSPLGQGLIKGYENGAAQPNLGAKSVAKYPISLPTLAEQKRIVEKLDSLREETQRLESLYQRKLAALDELKKSLLHRAFSGQL